MKTTKAIPPRLAQRLLLQFLRDELAEEVNGDLTEKFYLELMNRSAFLAKLNYWFQVLNYLRPFALRKSQRHQLNFFDMYRNYFTIGWRNIVQGRLFSIIKISGLSIGLTACLLIFLFIRDEVSYDQFHENKKNIYRIIQVWHYGANEPHTLGITNAIVGEEFARAIPDIKEYVRVNGVPVNLKLNDNVLTEQPLFVDKNFFSVFSFRLIHGDPKTALQDIHSVVLSEDMAKKYLGASDAIGKSLEIKLGDNIDHFVVTGITKNSPHNSTLKTEMLLPFQYFETRYNNNKDWIGGSLNTFILLKEYASIPAVVTKMQNLFDRNTRDKIAKAMEEQKVKIKIDFGLQPLLDIHLSEKAGPDNGMTDGSKPAYSYILGSIAVFILIIACINFVTLAVSQSLKRSKEVGIRKVIGGTRFELVRQFMIESFIITACAFFLAILLANLLIAPFNLLSGKYLSMDYLKDGYWYAGGILLLLITTFLAGIYPSLVLSSSQPMAIFSGRFKLMSKNYVTRGLIVLQFALAIFLVISTLVVNSQLNFLYKADMGYESTNLVRINVPVSKKSDFLPAQFKAELSGQKNILSVAARHGGRSISGVMIDDRMMEVENNKIDDNFIRTFKIPLVAGRNFSPEFPSDSLHAVIVNEAFVKEAGWKPEDAIGKAAGMMNKSLGQPVIVGVIKDYHFVSLREKIKPALYSMNPIFNFGQIWVKIGPEDVPQSLALIERTFKKLVPYFPYSYQFMDDIKADDYKTEARLRQLTIIASGLFIFISFMGLFGLAILSIEQRTKEIGIRKVLGAAVLRIARLISKDFVSLVFIAFLIAVPCAYLVVNQWLLRFAFHIAISWWLVGIAGLTVIVLSTAIVGIQAARAALANPVKNLRTE